jgi:hypothetical protein
MYFEYIHIKNSDQVLLPYHILFIGKYQYDTAKHERIINYCLQESSQILGPSQNKIKATMRTYDNLQNLKLCFGFSDSLSIQ